MSALAQAITPAVGMHLFRAVCPECGALHPIRWTDRERGAVVGVLRYTGAAIHCPVRGAWLYVYERVR